ncbi:DUF2875 family protein [Pseudacidovorax sp. RU35E]|uniref:DUF2875 family protein n=1 Tax=Pseudacidovorax sp. RU35E TaxID=1907403 RepID=UPI000954B37E|nr:DUF2875 family protein [Pseudacidovorax sp. RU35E]SIR78117.1 Protein of unknown function [Pseudacidovorax sp. RU35E]
MTYRPAKGERGRFVENYPVPMTMAVPLAPRRTGDALEAWAREYRNELKWQLRNGPAAMAFHDLAPRLMNLERGGAVAFHDALQAFDREGDLNSLILWAEDGYAVRAVHGGWEPPASQPAESLESILSRPKRPGQLRDSFSAILFKRPEAAEWLREWSLHVADRSDVSTFANGVTARGAHGYGGLHQRVYDDGAYFDAPPNGFIPTPNVPVPWSRPQYEQYSAMPTLALMLRPEFAFFQPDMSADRLAELLEGALGKVLGTPALRTRPPTRIFYSAPADVSRPALLARSLARVAPQAGLMNASTAFGLEQCLGGDLGAASMNAGLALGAIAVWESAEPALVVNLRDPGGAVVCGLWPVADDYRKTLNPRPYVI